MIINPYAFGAGVATDPDFASVVSLLHFDDADGSTTFTDQKSKTWTAVGNAHIENTQSKFGGTSGEFDGSGDVITTPDHADFDFGSGNWTVELWVYHTVTNQNALLIYKGNAGEYAPFGLQIANNQANFFCSTSGTAFEFNSGVTGSVATNTWTHLALVRDSTTMRPFVDGTAQATGSLTGALYVNTRAVAVGARSSLAESPLTGFIDDFRVTKGVARYTGSFTPPIAPFPDS